MLLQDRLGWLFSWIKFKVLLSLVVVVVGDDGVAAVAVVGWGSGLVLDS